MNTYDDVMRALEDLKNSMVLRSLQDDVSGYKPEASTNGSVGTAPYNSTVLGIQAITSFPMVLTYKAESFFAQYAAPTAANANNGDVYTYNFLLNSGTYTLRIYGVATTDTGYVDLTLDGVSVTTGINTYTGTPDYAATVAFTGITITTSGIHQVVATVNGKHASSTDYRWVCSAITMTRTGA
jgi:hypothetical protein